MNQWVWGPNFGLCALYLTGITQVLPVMRPSSFMLERVHGSNGISWPREKDRERRTNGA